MRIIFVNRFFYPDHSATSQILSDLAFYLATQDHEVMVLSSRQSYDDDSIRLPTFEVINHVMVQRLWTSRFGRANLLGRAIDYLTFYVSLIWCLLFQLKKNTILVTKTDPPMMSVVTSPIAVMKKAYQVNWLQDLFPEVAIALGMQLFTGRLGRWLSCWKNATLRKADMNVVIGEKMAQHLRDIGVRNEKIWVIPNWSDGDAIRALKTQSEWDEKNQLLADWQLNDKFIVGYSGNLGRAHEFDTVLKAAILLKAQKDIVFLFIGGGAYIEKLGEEVEQHSLTNICFQDYQPREKLNISLAVPDVHLVILRPELEGLIVPSKYYGIAAAAKPIVFIGDKQGEIARILDISMSGYSIEINDANALLEVIVTMQNNDAIVQEKGLLARQYFDKNYHMLKAFKCWDECLDEVVK